MNFLSISLNFFLKSITITALYSFPARKRSWRHGILAESSRNHFFPCVIQFRPLGDPGPYSAPRKRKAQRENSRAEGACSRRSRGRKKNTRAEGASSRKRKARRKNSRAEGACSRRSRGRKKNTRAEGASSRKRKARMENSRAEGACSRRSRGRRENTHAEDFPWGHRVRHKALPTRHDLLAHSVFKIFEVIRSGALS